jgi:hypothetical protein
VTPAIALRPARGGGWLAARAAGAGGRVLGAGGGRALHQGCTRAMSLQEHRAGRSRVPWQPPGAMQLARRHPWRCTLLAAGDEETTGSLGRQKAGRGGLKLAQQCNTSPVYINAAGSHADGTALQLAQIAVTTNCCAQTRHTQLVARLAPRFCAGSRPVQVPRQRIECGRWPERPRRGSGADAGACTHPSCVRSRGRSRPGSRWGRMMCALWVPARRGWRRRSASSRCAAAAVACCGTRTHMPRRRNARNHPVCVPSPA